MQQLQVREQLHGRSDSTHTLLDKVSVNKPNNERDKRKVNKLHFRSLESEENQKDDGNGKPIPNHRPSGR
jgi:hypothetical protein